MIGGGGVPETLLDTKGQLHGYSSTNVAVSVGSDNEIVYADSGNANGISYGDSPKSLMGTVGDILSASSANTLSVISASATSGHVLMSNGTGVLPSYQATPAGDVQSQILVMSNSTTIGDYVQPTASTCSSSATTPMSPTYETDFSSATGWSANTGKIQIDTGNSKMDFQTDGTYTDQEVYYDLTSVDNTKWIIRFKITFDTIALNGTVGQANEWKFGIYSINNPSGETPSGTDCICMTVASGSASIGNQIFSIDGGSRTTTYHNNVPFSTSTATATPFYCQLTRESATSITYKAFTNSDYSTGQIGSTTTHTCPATVVSLRYLMARIYSQSVSGAGAVGSITDVEFYNGVNTPSTVTNPCSNAIDDDVATSWKSDTETNPSIYVDMSSATTTSNLALYPNSASTETEIKVQSSPNASDWTDQRTITYSNLTAGAWNYIRFNLVSARYWRIYGSSGASAFMQIDEIKVLDQVADADIRDLHGHISISSSDTSLNNGGT